MYSFELFEAPKNIVVLYAGRFQPFHKGHRAVYEYLVKKFGRDAVYISTSNKTDNDKSPFTFSDKAYFMQIQGIPMDRVRETNQPYQNPDLVKSFDPENTALIVAVSDKDKDRFGKIGFKKDGSLSFFQDMPNELGDMAPISQHGYVMTVPTFDFNVYGKPMRSATEVRAMYRAANEQVRREIIKDLFGKWTQEAEQIMNAKLKEDIMPASQGTISPVHESWSKKYKKSIDCSNPKGFSQKAHCAGRKARQGGRKTKSQSVSENLEGRMIDLTKNFPTYTSLIGKITKENPTKVTIEIVQADGPGNVKVGDELRIATNYIKRLPVTESHHHTDIPGMLEKFLPIAMQELGITKLPGIKLTKHLKPHGTQASFGMYNPDDGKIYLAIADRHPVDILRTLAHELVHFSQDGKHELDAHSGETGSSEENEANSVAGVIMRKFNNEFPDAIKSEPLLAENLLGKDTPTPQEIMQKHGMTDQEFMQQLRLGRAVEMEHTNNPKVAIEIALDHINERPDYYTMLKSVERPMGESKKKVVSANYGIGKTPGVLAKVGPKGQVPRAKLHVNVPKKTAIKLGIPHTHLNEAFDAPYPMTWEHEPGESHDALVKLPDGTNLSIMFSVEYGDEGQEEWQVEFWRNQSLDVTGEGDAQRIFATVLSAIQQFIKIEKPERIKFSAAKQTGDMTPNASRTSLYNKLVQRFANSLGYNVKTTDHSLNTVYELERLREGVAEGTDDDIETTRQFRHAIALAKSQKAIRQAKYGKDQKFYADGTPVTPEEIARRAAERKAKKKGVAEGSEQVAIAVRKGRNKFATEMTVDGEPAGSYQYDANTGRSIAEVDPKYKGKGYGKILVLHAIYTAAMSGMDFVEDESRTSEYDNVLDSLDSNGYAINDDGYWYVTEEGEQFLKQALKQGVAENFADGKVKGKSRPGRVKAAGASCKGSVTDLRARAKKYSGERGKMYHWCANMKAGKKK